MAHQNQTQNERKAGWLCLVFWGVLIVCGIVAKRHFGHPDWMVFFRLPAAVFLVVAFHKLSAEFRPRYRQSLQTRRTR